jgi:hypothetical protein
MEMALVKARVTNLESLVAEMDKTIGRLLGIMGEYDRALLRQRDAMDTAGIIVPKSPVTQDWSGHSLSPHSPLSFEAFSDSLPSPPQKPKRSTLFPARHSVARTLDYHEEAVD